MNLYNTGVWRLSVALLVIGLAGLPVWCTAATTQPAAGGEASETAGQGAALRSVPSIDAASLQTIALGRQVYSELQVARQAALNRHADVLRSALKRVRTHLEQLSLPPALQALQAQMVIAAHDLDDTALPVDNDLWLPISVEFEKVSFYLPEQVRDKAIAAVSAGRAAAAKGDRRTASAELNALMSVLGNGRGVLRLNRIQADVGSAWSSASLPQPYWKGALEAVQSALGEFRWMAGVNARPLLSAYTDAVDAYVLWPQRKQAAIDYLDSSRRMLSEVTDDAGLAVEAHRLMEKNNLDDRDIRGFVEAIGRRIDSERAVQRRKLLDHLIAAQAA